MNPFDLKNFDPSAGAADRTQPMPSDSDQATRKAPSQAPVTNRQIEKSLEHARRLVQALPETITPDDPSLLEYLQPLDRVTNLYKEVMDLLKQYKRPPETAPVPPTHWLSVVAVAHVRLFVEVYCAQADPDTMVADPLEYCLPPELERTLKLLPHDTTALWRSLELICAQGENLVMDVRVRDILTAMQRLDAGLNRGTTGEATPLIEQVPTLRDHAEFKRYYDALSERVYVQALPPELAQIEQTLLEESPWLAPVARRVFRMVRSRQAMAAPDHERHLPTLLLVGSPGSGKTHFLMRLGELLNLAPLAVPVGGMADSMTLRGAPRGYSSSRPSLLVQHIVDTGVANPMVILDEIEKCGTGRHNGNALDVLLQLLEPGTAGRFLDECLQTHVNLAHVSFLATANDITTLPDVIADRFQVVRVPDPAQADLEALAGRLWLDQMREYGFAQPTLVSYPHDLIKPLLTGRPSLRRIRRGVESLAEQYVTLLMQDFMRH